jgi:hypothetical protein
MAERPFAVGLPDWQKAAVEFRRVVEQIAVVREDPVAPPKLANERVRVFQTGRPLRCLANVGDDIERMDRTMTNQFRHRRFARRRRGLAIRQNGTTTIWPIPLEYVN